MMKTIYFSRKIPIEILFLEYQTNFLCVYWIEIGDHKPGIFHEIYLF